MAEQEYSPLGSILEAASAFIMARNARQMEERKMASEEAFNNRKLELMKMGYDNEAAGIKAQIEIAREGYAADRYKTDVGADLTRDELGFKRETTPTAQNTIDMFYKQLESGERIATIGAEGGVRAAAAGNRGSSRPDADNPYMLGTQAKFQADLAAAGAMMETDPIGAAGLRQKALADYNMSVLWITNPEAAQAQMARQAEADALAAANAPPPPPEKPSLLNRVFGGGGGDQTLGGALLGKAASGPLGAPGELGGVLKFLGTPMNQKKQAASPDTTLYRSVTDKEKLKKRLDETTRASRGSIQ